MSRGQGRLSPLCEGLVFSAKGGRPRQILVTAGPTPLSHRHAEGKTRVAGLFGVSRRQLIVLLLSHAASAWMVATFQRISSSHCPHGGFSPHSVKSSVAGIAIVTRPAGSMRSQLATELEWTAGFEFLQRTTNRVELSRYRPVKRA